MKTIHILLVEDNEGDILLTSEALEETKLHIHLSVVKDGKEAIDFMNEQADKPEKDRVNLVLLDVNIPKRNGHEVLCYIKGNKTLHDIPVIMLTTSSSQKDIDLSRKNDVDIYIIKPLEAADMLTIVHSLQNPVIVPPLSCQHEKRQKRL